MSDLRLLPDLRKTLAAVVGIVARHPGVEARKATLILYLIDRHHVNGCLRPITCDVYYAAPDGPMGANAMHLIEGERATLSALGIAKRPFAHLDVADGRILTDADRSAAGILSRAELASLNYILERTTQMATAEVAEWSRRYPDWSRARRGATEDSRGLRMRYELMAEAWAKPAALLRMATLPRSP